MIRLACQDRPQEHPLLHTHSNSHSQCNTKSFFRWHRLSCYETERGFSRYGQIPLLKEQKMTFLTRCVFLPFTNAIHKCATLLSSQNSKQLHAARPSAGKRARPRRKCFWFYFFLVEKLAREF